MLIRQFLSMSPVVALLRRLIEKKLRNNLGLWKGSAYFRQLFATFRKKSNVEALDFEHGLLVSSFQGQSFFLTFAPPSLIESFVLIDGVWEPHIANLVYALTSADDGIVIDIGANVGASTIPIAVCRRNTQFYLFEPHPRVFEQLKKNCRVNNLRNVEPIQSAISNLSDTHVSFFAQDRSSNMGLSSLLKNDNITGFNEIFVPNIRLDDFFEGISKQSNKRRVRLIKIDVQGFELEVLRSAKQTIAENRPFIIFEFESEYSMTLDKHNEMQQHITEFFNEINYDLYCVERHTSFMPKLKFPGYFHGDILATPG